MIATSDDDGNVVIAAQGDEAEDLLNALRLATGGKDAEQLNEYERVLARDFAGDCLIGILPQ